MNGCSVITEGKTKRFWTCDDPELAVMAFKNEAVAFQGLKRGRIHGKAACNNAINDVLFRILMQAGIPTHYVRKLDTSCALVKRCEMLPIEVKVRRRVAGSLANRIGLPIGSYLHVPVVEFLLKNEKLDNPLLNVSHIRAMMLATKEEMDYITETALRVNALLTDKLAAAGLELVDIQLEFGRYQGQLLVCDDICPDTARIWDRVTLEPLDIDRFRRDLGNTEQAYQDLACIISRLEVDA